MSTDSLTSAETNQRGYRLTSIDMLRGLAIVVMALDHVRDFVMHSAGADIMADPNVSPLSYFTRWITHFCAPAFVFLAGVSAGLMTKRKGPGAMAAFLGKRGFWIIFLQMTVISSAWTFSPFGMTELDGRILFAMIVLLHNLLDAVWPAAGPSDWPGLRRDARIGGSVTCEIWYFQT